MTRPAARLLFIIVVSFAQLHPSTAQVTQESAGVTTSDPSTMVAPAPPSPIQTDGTGRSPTASLLPHDLSPWSMFMAADILVKGVMVGLAFASLMTWTVFFAKTIEFGFARRRLRRGLVRLDGVKSFSEARLALGQRDKVLGTFLGAVTRELEQSDRAVRGDGIKERVGSRLVELTRAENQAMRRGMPLLATIGSTAPFVGLFGTVWGIMNAFIGISKAQTTNLAVVAPGIAEALLATAIGLVAAIPAVIIYNHFSQAGRRHQSLIGEASGCVQRLLSRELDRRSAGVAIEAAG